MEHENEIAGYINIMATSNIHAQMALYYLVVVFIKNKISRNFCTTANEPILKWVSMATTHTKHTRLLDDDK